MQGSEPTTFAIASDPDFVQISQVRASARGEASFMHHVSLVAGTKRALHHGCGSLPQPPVRSALAAAARIKVNELVPQSTWPLHDQRAGLRTKRIFVKYHLPPTTNPIARAPYRKQLRADGTTSLHRVPRARTSTETLERELAWTAKNKPNKSDIRDILSILIQERGVQPSSRHYEALILENCHPQQGSIASLEAVLEEMKVSDVAKGAAIHSAVLKVLAVHPSPQLRKKTLDEMSHLWMQKSSEDRHMLAAALVREGQIQLAQAEIAKMRKDNVHVERWLYVLLIYGLRERSEYDTILKLAYELHDNGIELPVRFWEYVIRRLGRPNHQHVALFQWIWEQYVEPMHIRLSESYCGGALKWLATEGHPKLAEKVMATMNTVGKQLSKSHEHLRAVAYEKSGQQHDPTSPLPLTMQGVFSKVNSHDQAYFDPRIAIKKRPLPRFMNPKKRAHRQQRREKVNYLSKASKALARRTEV